MQEAFHDNHCLPGEFWPPGILTALAERLRDIPAPTKRAIERAEVDAVFDVSHIRQIDPTPQS
jgi:hypothetical protein